MGNHKDASILIVDDEPVNVSLLKSLLDLDGYSHVASTTDPRVAVPLAVEHRADLVLLDLNMPYMDGFQVMQTLRETMQEDVPCILVLTADIERESRLRALDEGARDFITKPFDRVELLTRIRNMLDVQIMQKQIRDQNRLLEERVAERTKELHDTRQEIIRRLGRAAEYRDNETGLHIIRMSKICQLLALAAGMGEDEAELLLQASPMHDIGKIGIPDYILLKSGGLTVEEWTVMQSHTRIGADLLAGHHSRLLSMASEIALTHHEHWDGSGYPQHLLGEEIPLVSRIVAIADVYDALTSERPYKEAWPHEKALEYIRLNSGTHFDPHIVSLFIDNLQDILEIKQHYADQTPHPGRYYVERTTAHGNH